MNTHGLIALSFHTDEAAHRSNLSIASANLRQRFEDLVDDDPLLEDGDAEEVLRDFLIPAMQS